MIEIILFILGLFYIPAIFASLLIIDSRWLKKKGFLVNPYPFVILTFLVFIFQEPFNEVIASIFVMIAPEIISELFKTWKIFSDYGYPHFSRIFSLAIIFGTVLLSYLVYRERMKLLPIQLINAKALERRKDLKRFFFILFIVLLVMTLLAAYGFFSQGGF